MVVAYQSTGTPSWATGDASPRTVAPSYPASIAAGDLLILQAFRYGPTATLGIDTPDGWTPLFNDPFDQGARSFRQAIFGKIAAGGESGTVTVSTTATVLGGGSNSQLSGAIHRFTGAASSSYVEGAAITVGEDPVIATVSAPTVQSTAADQLAVCMLNGDDNVAGSSFTGETGGDWTEAFEIVNGTGGDGVIQLQTASIGVGTLSGGTTTFSFALHWFARGFVIKAPGAAVEVAPGAGVLGLLGYVPTVAVDAAVITATSQLTVAGYAPTVEAGGALTERLSPDAVLAGGSNLQDTDLVSPPVRVADLADETSGSPGPDELFWTAVDPEADIDVRLSFPATGGNLIGTQTINVLIRGTSLPARDWKLELFESGEKRTSETTGSVTSLDGEVVTLTFQPDELADVTGAGVEVRISAIAA
jgi:hypothetical protein